MNNSNLSNIISFDKYQKALSPDIKNILRSISETVVNHPILADAYGGICKTMLENEAYSERSHLLILGESGCGKSTLCDMIATKFGPVDREFHLGLHLDQTALIASLSSPLTPRFIAKTLLRALGHQGSLAGTSDTLTDRLLTTLKQCGTKLIILDETQHLQALGITGNGYSHKLRESLDWIKSLISKTSITFVLMGMPTLLELIEADEQLARRFSTVYYLKPFGVPFETDSDRGNRVYENRLGIFVDALLERACELPYFDEHDTFANNIPNAARVYLATAGTPARISKLVIKAAQVAYESQVRRITIEHFAKAYTPEKAVRAQISQRMASSEQLTRTMSRLVEGKTLNPFELDSADLFSISQGEAD